MSTCQDAGKLEATFTPSNFVLHLKRSKKLMHIMQIYEIYRDEQMSNYRWNEFSEGMNRKMNPDL